jgi:hypothetical protein
MLPLYIINEHPKSGGTWVGQLLMRALDVPFPRNRFPMLKSSIMHGHYAQPGSMKNVTVVWRDGRDVMISWYFHCFFKNDHNNEGLVRIVRKDLPFKNYDDIRENLAEFIEYAFSRQKHPHFSWADFVRSWYGRNGVTYVRYEDMRNDTPGELQRIFSEITGKKLAFERAVEIANEFSFTKQSGRKPGQECKASFMRKGLIGDWRNYFNNAAKKVFDQYGGDELILLGYEKEHSWIHNI